MRLFQHGQRSLFGEILDWMLTPLLLLVPVSIGVTWLVAQGIANRPFDRALEHNVQTLAALVTVQDKRVRFYLPQPSRDILRGDDTDRVYYQVRGAEGDLLGGDADLPLPPDDEVPTDERVFIRTERMRDEPVRVAYTWVQPALTGSGLVLVQVGETREKQKVLATEIIKGVLLPQFAILPLAILLIWLALVRGIKPLSELEDRIRERKPDDLSPLDDSAVPVEVAPLVMSVNGLLTKLQVSIAIQRRFLADAAHQLKTPLAGLRMQADLAQRQGASADDLKQSLQQIGRASVRATHTVNQLLALARAEGGAGARAWQRCDLARLTIDVVREAVPRAIEKRIDLGYDGAEPGALGVMFDGNLTLLKEMVRNLVDNAINYTPSSDERPGVITARVLADPFGHVVLLQVEDSGPGIPEHERELVFEPFYRVLGNEADGSGLGLPIVLEIARQHKATVHLEDARPGRQPPGVRFSVRFETV
ncbi:sensor histidine kinase [Variovorax sp. RT4R15]|uniref:sensor histidine kinase n=1 Tax=Variovorax sp. RT4R15 TaxID=3443737 RepID=UPI003F456668